MPRKSLRLMKKDEGERIYAKNGAIMVKTNKNLMRIIGYSKAHDKRVKK